MSFSLKNDVGKTEEVKTAEKQELINKVEAVNDFTQDDLTKAWNKMAEMHQNQPRLYQNLIKYQPRKKKALLLKFKCLRKASPGSYNNYEGNC